MFFKVITLGRFPNENQSYILEEVIRFMGAILLIAILVLVAWLYFK